VPNFCLCSSNDGSKMYGIDVNSYSGKISRSTDYGATWQDIAVPYITTLGQRWGISCSSDGTKVLTGDNNSPGKIRYSTDSGNNWIELNTSVGNRQWLGFYINSDGTKMFANELVGYIYVSTDSGITWTPRGSSLNRSIYMAGSSDGTKLVTFPAFGTYLIVSTDSGTTWTNKTLISYNQWSGVCVSNDGKKMAATVGYTGDYIYVSTDSGNTWISKTSLGSRAFTGITSDNNDFLYTTWNNNYVYVSYDFGDNWRILDQQLLLTHYSDLCVSKNSNKFAVFGSSNKIGSYHLIDNSSSSSSSPG
jgi:hypothetical protein